MLNTSSRATSILKASLLLWAVSFLVKVILCSALIFPRSESWSSRLMTPPTVTYDDMEYMEVARLLVQHGQLLMPESWCGEEGTYRQIYRTPGYPVILAAIGLACRWSPVAMVLLHAFVLSACPVLLAGILRRERWSTAAAWCFALDPLTNLLAISFVTEVWLILGLLLALRFWQEGRENALFRIGSFVVLALAVLVKPSIQYFLVVFLVLTLIHHPRRRMTWVAALVACLPLLAWMGRNYAVCGLARISTQEDACIMAPVTIDAMQWNMPVEEAKKEWDKKLEEPLMRMIMDNKLDFIDPTRTYLREHPVPFIKYHLLGMLRICLGTGREHFRQTLWLGRPDAGAAMSLYNVVMLVYYLALYAVVVAGLNRRSWRHPLTQTAILFTAYNLGMIGIFAYSTGGGLKRAPFVPFLYLLLGEGLPVLTARTRSVLRIVGRGRFGKPESETA